MNKPPLPIEFKIKEGIPEGYRQMRPEEITRPGEDLYRNSQGTWSVSMNAAPVGNWTIFARKEEKRKAQPREIVPARRAVLRKESK